jgi:hypothetical protein
MADHSAIEWTSSLRVAARHAQSDGESYWQTVTTLGKVGTLQSLEISIAHDRAVPTIAAKRDRAATVAVWAFGWQVGWQIRDAANLFDARPKRDPANASRGIR